MPTPSVARLLDRLDELKRPSGVAGRKRLRTLLAQIARRRFGDADSLTRLHEILLFMRAYPQGARLLRQTESILKTFGRRVAEARDLGADLSPLAEPEVSGIAGTEFSAIFSYDVVRWLAGAHPSRVEIDWEDYEDRAHLNVVWPRLLPLFEEDAYVDTRAPFLKWLRAARRRGESDLQWLMRGFDRLPVSERERAELFDPLKIWVRWRLGDTRAARTHARRGVRKIFFHTEPLLGRRDVSLPRELEGPPLAVEKLTRADAERMLAVARDAMAVRYRELHGFTYPDARSVVRADAGRGTEVYAWGVPPERRLPLLAYLSMMVFKNGLPAAYAEGLTLFERTEIGFNLFYTFRDGESAWTYARVMRLLRQLHGVETFSVEPYQLGSSGNEEGIESGAFWFYRKLGFRPTDAGPSKLLRAEERKLAARPGYRTPPATLRRMASGYALYETARAEAGAWDNFRVRHIGLAVQHRTRDHFGGDPERMRAASAAQVARALKVSTARWSDDERRAFGRLSLALALIPDLARWTPDERRRLVPVIRAKAGPDETKYARLLHGHARLRRALIELGSTARR